MHRYVERVVDLIDPAAHRLYGMSETAARQRIGSGDPDAVKGIEGSFALFSKVGKRVRMARSLDRPMRYFLAKKEEGPTLIIADRIDRMEDWLKSKKLDNQFHTSYTRMVPAHYIVSIDLVGCPDPDPFYTRFFNPKPDAQPDDIDVIGRHYIAALSDEVARWIVSIPEKEPLGVCFSGGIDSGAVFLVAYHTLQKLGMNPSRLKAFSLSIDGGKDSHQAFDFLDALGFSIFLEVIESDESALNVDRTLRVLEDYKALDVECAAVGLALCQGIRERYPEWRYLIDGDGGDENLKDYPIEDNPELTIQSVLHNRMLYHEGWGVGKIKHSLTYSGGLSRSYTRSYAPAKHCGFEGFSPFTRPRVIEVAEGIPFTTLTQYDPDRLYALKGQVVSAGVRQVLGFDMPIFPKRRFQHGATSVDKLRERITNNEAELRSRFQALYS